MNATGHYKCDETSPADSQTSSYNFAQNNSGVTSQTPVEVRFPTCTLKLQWAAARPWECFLDFSFRPV